MVFILDQALHNTLVGEHGKHALYDYICWEYLLGKEQSPCVFTEEDLKETTPLATAHCVRTNPDRTRASRVTISTVFLRDGAFLH